MPFATSFRDQLYSSVRAYGVKGLLLPPATITSLAEASDLDDLVNRLKTTVYASALTEARSPYTPEQLEILFKRSLVATHYALAQSSSPPNLMEAYFMKYIGSNLKTVLRSLALGRGFEEAKASIDLYAEELVGRRETVAKALSARNLDEAVALLAGGEFGSEAAGAIEVFRERNDPQVIDVFIDKAFYQRVSDAHRLLTEGRLKKYRHRGIEALSPIVAADVDGYNSLAVLRGKLWNLPLSRIRELFVDPGFEVATDLLEEAATAATVEEALKRLKRPPYHSLFDELEASEDGIRELEERFRQFVLGECRRSFRWHPLGPVVSLAAVKLKEEEIGKLAAIAFGVEQKLGARRILEKIRVER